MIKWMRRKLRSFVLEVEEDDGPRLAISGNAGRKTIGLSKRETIGLDDDHHDPMRFTVYNANGGKILETRTYDKRSDCWVASLHVIDSSEDFGTAVGKIVFMEMLKKG